MAEHMTDEATLSLSTRQSVQRNDAICWLSTQDNLEGLDKLCPPQLIGAEGEGWWEERRLLVVYKGKHIRHFGERIFN